MAKNKNSKIGKFKNSKFWITTIWQKKNSNIGKFKNSKFWITTLWQKKNSKIQNSGLLYGKTKNSKIGIVVW